jgi:P27 family predicted phage terminase small subunit
MPRGRPPKPIELRQAEGDDKHGALPVPVEAADLALDRAPDVLGDTGAAFWNEIVEMLGGAGVLKAIDRAALTAMCLQLDRADEAGRLLDDQGLVSKGSTGQMSEHPALKIEARAHTLLLKFASEYAATPVARARVAAARHEERKANEFEEIVGELVEETEIDAEAL